MMMTESKADARPAPNLKYTTQKHLINQNLKIKIISLIDENHTLKNNDKHLEANNIQILITGQLFNNEKNSTPERTTKLIRKMYINEELEIPMKISNLSYNSIIALTIWSLDRSFDEEKPIGSTTISVFDSNLKMREGKHSLLIWPDRLPDLSIDSQTPGLLTDPNINDLNFYNRRLENFERYFEEGKKESASLDNKCLQSLRNQQVHYAYSKIPAAFLEIEFPYYDTQVIYEDVDNWFDYAIGIEQNYNVSYFIETSSFSNNLLVRDWDHDYEKSNPVKDQYMQILRSDDDANAKELKPGPEENALIQKILFKPIFGHISSEDKNMLWKYRYSLTKNKEALLKFLHCVNWSHVKESVEGLELLMKWERIDYQDSLHLLSSFFCANDEYNRNSKPIDKMLKIRKYALGILEEQDNEKISISSMLLQLVQALRYEEYSDRSPLLNFLVKKASSEIQMASTFYWHLKVETLYNEGEVGRFFQTALQVFLDTLQDTPEGVQIYEQILLQDDFRNYLISVNTKVKKSGRADKKTEEAKKLLQSYVFTAHRMCIDPGVQVDNVNIDGLKVFKSAMAPLLLSFGAHRVDDSKPDNSDKIVYKVMFKNGDDIRQDQLILQIIALMDSLLKKVKLDLKLTPYRALACGKLDGYLEFVSNSDTIQAVLKDEKKEHKNNMYDYFRKLAKIAAENTNSWLYSKKIFVPGASNETAYDCAFRTIIDNYVDSLAGYCVITYILGIGDRHLENLMINNEGKFFHIDFGFILGRDPKIQPPPFKLSREMFEVIKKTNNEERFRIRCIDVYKYLRGYSKLIINLFNLMSDSGLPHVDEKGLERLWERFHLEEENADIDNTIIALIDESMGAVLTRLFDTIHEIVSQAR